MKLVFNCDIVGNPGTLFMGLSGYDTDRVADFMRNLAGKEHDVNVVGGTTIPYSDHFSFGMKGVPALMAATGGPKYPNMGPHTYGDTLDKVDLRALRSSTAYAERVAAPRERSSPAPRAPCHTRGSAGSVAQGRVRGPTQGPGSLDLLTGIQAMDNRGTRPLLYFAIIVMVIAAGIWLLWRCNHCTRHNRKRSAHTCASNTPLSRAWW